MFPRITISDSDLVVGEPRLATAHPVPDTLASTRLDQLDRRIEALLQRITALETRVSELAARTWWTLLVSQLKLWFRRS